MTPIIEFKNYTFKYRSQSEPTLREIDLTVNPGEKVLIVGPSGSGKSTLVHCINGMVPFSYPGESSGTLTVGGKDPAKTGIFGMSKIVGTVLQDTDGQFIGLTVAEDVAFALENDCVEQEEMFRAVDEVAEVVDIKALLGNAPTELSGGQKQRVSMAGVLVDDVDILLFDEPLHHLAGFVPEFVVAHIHFDFGIVNRPDRPDLPGARQDGYHYRTPVRGCPLPGCRQNCGDRGRKGCSGYDAGRAACLRYSDSGGHP